MSAPTPLASLLLRGVFGSPLIGPRSVLDAVRIAADPARSHYQNTLSAVPYAAAMQWYSNVQARFQEPLERWATRPGVFDRVSSWDIAGLENFVQRQGLGGLDRYFRTHPIIENLLMDWKFGRPESGLRTLQSRKHTIPSWLLPVLREVLGVMERSGRAASEVASARSFLDTRPVVQEGGRRLDPKIFVGLNSRGIDGYDRHLFGVDPLISNGFHVEPSEKTIDRMIESLPQGAVVADWGAGAGLFAVELHELRPDLRLFIADQFSPSEVVAEILPGPTGISILECLAGCANILAGDALEVRLPHGERADAIFSVALSPYVPDPLRLIAHLYNQLKPGGLLVMTVTDFMHDVTLPWQKNQSVILDVTEELSRQKIRYGFFRRHKTLVLQRADERTLRVTAELVGSYYEPFQMNLGFRKAELEHCLSFYRPGPDARRRWMSLEI